MAQGSVGRDRVRWGVLVVCVLAVACAAPGGEEDDGTDGGATGAGGSMGAAGATGAGAASGGGDAGGDAAVNDFDVPGFDGGAGGDEPLEALDAAAGGGAPEVDAEVMPAPDAAPPPPPPPEALDCVYDSDTFGEPRAEIDVGPDSNERIVAIVRALPDPAVVEQATLTFVSYDADHPGEEGRIFVNGQGPYDLPANAAWDNMRGEGAVDVTGATVAGENRVEFSPGPLERSYFGIRNVRIALRARVDACPEGPPPPPPPPEAVEREIRYPQAEYTNRRTWVLGCENNPARAYAYTARGEEHVEVDCEGRYRAGGNRRGDAIFRFDDVVDAEYEIVIASRHTENRNPNQALFLVNGEARRINQRTDRDFTTDVWGRRRLSGQVEVILRAEGESDCVISVRLVPVGG